MTILVAKTDHAPQPKRARLCKMDRKTNHKYTYKLAKLQTGGGFFSRKPAAKPAAKPARKYPWTEYKLTPKQVTGLRTVNGQIQAQVDWGHEGDFPTGTWWHAVDGWKEWGPGYDRVVEYLEAAKGAMDADPESTRLPTVDWTEEADATWWWSRKPKQWR